MAYDFKELKQNIEDTNEWLKKEYQAVRTGRATLALLDSVQVTAYSSQMPIKELATISIEDARTLRIAPWDMTVAKEIEKAITNSSLGVSASADDQGLRVIFPDLTSERREQLIKVVKEKHEQANISLRGVRDETWADLQKQEKNKEISEDDKFRYKEEMEKLVMDGNNGLDEIVSKKQKEIMN